MDINEIVEIQMALNDLDIGLTVAVNLGTVTYTDTSAVIGSTVLRCLLTKVDSF